MDDVEEEQFGATIRTKRIRAAHRGAVTRLINQLEDALTSADVGRLKQLKQSLSGKLDTLSKLDEELLLRIEEDQLENEIEQADIVREKAELAIIHIDEEITKLTRPIKSKRRTRTPEAQLPTRVMKVTAHVDTRPSFLRPTHRGTRLLLRPRHRSRSPYLENGTFHL